MNREEREDLEIELVLEAVSTGRGHDFRQYARASMRRRLQARLDAHGLKHFSQLIPLILHDEAFYADFLLSMSVTITEMFRDPFFYQSFREKIVPALRTYPLLKVWHAGCATGEEPYSMAILLQEEGLLEHTQIYATDLNKHSLTIAKRGMYSEQDMVNHAKNYRAAGGKAELSDYYRSNYGSVKMADNLREHILFSTHNLVTDGVFGEMHVVICRNVLIYFNRDLQARVLSLFRDSLTHRGFLCLGDKESITFSHAENDFEDIDLPAKIFKKLSFSSAPPAAGWSSQAKSS